jgi:hypothetical protein
MRECRNQYKTKPNDDVSKATLSFSNRAVSGADTRYDRFGFLRANSSPLHTSLIAHTL